MGSKRKCMLKENANLSILNENPLLVIHFYYMERLTHDSKSFVKYGIHNRKLIMRYF